MSTYGPVTQSGGVTSYLPISSAWPSSAGCNSLFVDPFTTPTPNFLSIIINDPRYAADAGSGPSCMPPEVSSWWYQTPIAPTTTLLGGYSMNCPQAYGTSYSFATSGTTTIGCCPSFFTFASPLDGPGRPLQCYSTYPPGVYTYMQQDSTSGASTTTSSSISTSLTVYAVQVNGYIFPSPTSAESMTSNLAQLSSSLTSTTSGIASSGASATRSTTATSVAVPTATATIVPSGLSSGAKAGVGIAVAVGIIGVACFLAAVLLFRRKSQAAMTAMTATAYTELPENSIKAVTELPTNPIQPVYHDRDESQKVKGRMFELHTRGEPRPCGFCK